MAPPAAGSVPEPNSSIRIRLEELALCRSPFIFVRCELYVLRSFSMDCSSPISTKISSKMRNSEISAAGTRIPHWNIYCSNPAVLRQTDFPPAFGPDIISRCFCGVNVSVRGTICFFSLLRVASRMGWRPRMSLYSLSLDIMGFPASIFMESSAFALMKSSSPINSALSSRLGR